jgi:hypothetical protein
MKFALIDGKKTEASKGAKGLCPSCGSELIAKCGEVKVHHWAHNGSRTCDPWWENETNWHRSWKGQFPVDWQEVAHRAESGEKHIADVKTDQDWVLEFQHSYLKPEERRAREAFYDKLVWVADGTRRKRDRSQFFNALKEGVRVSEKAPVLRLRGFLDECVLLWEWAGSHAPIFFDFGDDSGLWYLLPESSDRMAYVVNFSRIYFIELFRGGAQKAHDLAFWLKDLSKLVSDYNSSLRSQSLSQLAPQFQNGRSRRPQSFQKYLARKERSRRRF